MDYSRNSKFKAALLVIALITLSACSSSKLDDGSAPPETAGDAQAPVEASTDAVPAVGDPSATAAPVAEDPSLAQQPAPGSLDAAQPAGDPAAVADAGAPMGDPSVVADPAAAAPVTDVAPVANVAPVAPAPVADTSMPSTFVADTSSIAPVSGDAVQYKVKRGDTLMKIAFENYGDLYRWKEIYEANRSHISDPNAVPPGTQLTLNGAGMVQVERNGERYLIKHGDTLGVISHDVYGTPRKWKKLWENNRQLIKDPNKIYAGFYLFYQPEGRLTHDQDAPADGGSAQNLPFKNQAQPAKEVASAEGTSAPLPGTPVAIPADTAAQAPQAVPVGERVPASNK